MTTLTFRSGERTAYVDGHLEPEHWLTTLALHADEIGLSPGDAPRADDAPLAGGALAAILEAEATALRRDVAAIVEQARVVGALRSLIAWDDDSGVPAHEEDIMLAHVGLEAAMSIVERGK